MNQLTPLWLLHVFWRAGGLGVLERIRLRLPRPYWVSRRLFGARFAVDASASLTQSLLYLWGERLIAERRERDRPVMFLELHPDILPRFGHSMTEIVAEIRDLYGQSVEFYRDVTRDLPPLYRLAVYYQLTDPVQRYEDPHESVAHLPRDKTGTIWCVAGRRV